MDSLSTVDTDTFDVKAVDGTFYLAGGGLTLKGIDGSKGKQAIGIGSDQFGETVVDALHQVGRTWLAGIEDGTGGGSQHLCVNAGSGHSSKLRLDVCEQRPRARKRGGSLRRGIPGSIVVMAVKVD